jgi:hypothetical protein
MEERRDMETMEAPIGAATYRPVASIASGQILAQPILGEDGRVLIKAGTPLNERYAAVLAKRGVTGVYVIDPRKAGAAQWLEGGVIDDGSTAPAAVSPADYQAELVRRLSQRHLQRPAGEDVFGRGKLGLGSERLSLLGRSLAEIQRKLRTGWQGPIASSALQDAGRLIVSEVMASFRQPFAIPPIHAGASYDIVHPLYSALLAVRLGATFSMREEDLQRLGTAGVLMDLGMCKLPAGLVDVEGPLSPESQARMHEHPSRCAQLLKESGFSTTVCQMVLEHHERWDGGGYPRKRAGEDIFRSARVLSVASTYVALISDRPYRAAHLPHAAMEFLFAYAGEWWDPAIVQLLVNTVAAYGAGTRVVLDDGTKAAILDPRPGQPGRPIVKLDNGPVVDLALPGQLHRSIAAVDSGSDDEGNDHHDLSVSH